MKKLLKAFVVAVMTLEARVVLRRQRPSIVAVTGSVGKTSTKDAIFTVLSSHVRVRKSDKSFNSDIGIPLTILGLSNAWSNPLQWMENLLDGAAACVRVAQYPAWLVLEVGADHPGDIKRTARWLHPDIVVLTRFPELPVHVENFESTEAVIEEKRDLRRALKETGVLIVNGDDPVMRDEPVFETQRRLRYGILHEADIQGSNIDIVYEDDTPVGMKMTARFQNTTGELILRGTLGEHQLYPILAAVAVGIAEGYTLDTMVTALSAHASPRGRMRILQGQQGTVLIDDTYNASPVAVSEALRTLGRIRTRGVKYAVLGDMLELGAQSIVAHRQVGAEVFGSADVFIAVGVRMKEAALSAHAAGMPDAAVQTFPDARTAGAYLQSSIRSGDVILIKGSQSMRMERVVAACLSDPSRTEDLLVRQDAEWLKRA